MIWSLREWTCLALYSILFLFYTLRQVGECSESSRIRDKQTHTHIAHAQFNVMFNVVIRIWKWYVRMRTTAKAKLCSNLILYFPLYGPWILQSRAKKKMCVLSFALISVLLLHSMANWYTFDKGFARTFQRSSIYISSTQCVCLSNRHRFGNATFYLMQFMRTKQKNWASLLFHICLCSSSSWQNIPLLEFGGLCSSFVNQIWWLLIYSRWSSAIYFFVVIHFFFLSLQNRYKFGRERKKKT